LVLPHAIVGWTIHGYRSGALTEEVQRFAKPSLPGGLFLPPMAIDVNRR
jgi:hypothetical protein